MAQRYDEEDDTRWNIHVGLPDNTDPTPGMIQINYDADENRPDGTGHYTVQFKINDMNVYEFWEIPYQTPDGNVCTGFGVHIGDDFEKTLELNEIERTSEEDIKSL